AGAGGARGGGRGGGRARGSGGARAPAAPRPRLRPPHSGAPAAPPADDPQAAACLAVARAWLAGPDKGAPDPELASAAVAATRATADPVLISSRLCAAGTAAPRPRPPREANRITPERPLLLPALDRNDPHCPA